MGEGAHTIVNPPLTLMVWPVMKSESGQTRNRTIAAISSGFARGA
jgi:hypothetical protein